MTDKQWITRWHDHAKNILPPMSPIMGESKEEMPSLYEKNKDKPPLKFPRPKNARHWDEK